MSLLSRLAVEASRAYGFLTGSTTNVSADFLVVAGGGGGGGAVNASPFYYQGSTGSSSSISGTGLTTITSIGGGGGGTYLLNAFSGGSGGGGGASSSSAGSGTANQGYAGGAGKFATDYTGGGGGGAGAIGSDATGSGATLKAGNGGAGVASSISGSSVTYAGGGGGAGTNTGGQGTGGSGGGGNGSKGSNGVAGTANLGGGGGGGDFGGGAGEGGGGAGGFRTSAGTSGGGASAESTISLSTLNTYSIVVGAGGNGGGTGATGTGGNGGSGIVIISYTSATPKFLGGTITTSGGKQIHTFTSSGTLSPITPITASYLVVAGGGGGGGGRGGGGGGGGLQTSSTTLYSGATYVVTVGAGGNGGVGYNGTPSNGSNSVISGTGLTTLTSVGGGYGANQAASVTGTNGANGGSGGGGVTDSVSGTSFGTGGTATSGQGNNGGTSAGASNYPGGGGGGAGAAGSNATGSTGGNGGNGTASSISGSSVTYAGGGGGGTYNGGTAGSGGTGGGGAAGAGSTSTVNNGTAGTPNLGGGGGAGNQPTTGYGNGGNGGSGVVIISYAGSQVFNGGLVTTSGGNTIHTFTSTGALTPLTNNLNNSLRFRSSASANLQRTPTNATNRKTWTWSGWVKRGTIGSIVQGLFMANYDGNDNSTYFGFGGDQFFFFNRLLTVANGNIYTTAVYRDPSAWYHIVVAMDTTQATAANRFKLYVNGNQVTSFAIETYPTQNTDMYINSNVQHNIGFRRDGSTNNYFDGYLADVNFIDGQQLEPYYFGNNDANGVWKPIQYKGTYGTNGFYLTFGNTTSTTTLGYDSSPNGNNWTCNNISLTAGSTYDAMTDVPTNTSATVANYCTLNPIATNTVGVGTLSNANLNFSIPNTYTVYGTMSASSGKYYWEAVATSSPIGVGIKQLNVLDRYSNTIYYMGSSLSTGEKYVNGTGSAYGASWTTGDVIGVAVDMDGGTVTFYKNNASQGSINLSLATITEFVPTFVSGAGATFVGYVNFGQRPFTYTPPTGYVALNTYNLPTPTILQGNKYMDANLWSGNSSAQTIVNQTQFKPDFVWVKSRTNTQWNNLTDSVRGVTKLLYSNATNAEATNSTALTSFNSNGFSLGDDSGGNGVNTSGQNYVGWQWQAGQGSTSSNTSGSITSTVSVNTTAGFSVVTYTGNGTNGATVGHGLGVTPAMIIIKNRTSGNTNSWRVWQKYLGTSSVTQTYLLDGTNAAFTDSNIVTAVSANTFTLGIAAGNTSVNGNSNTYVAYCWAEIAGFSKFGSYTGNGSADGPFVFTGFRPKFVLIKASSTSASWAMYDTSRNTYNLTTQLLEPNTSAAEYNGGTTAGTNDYVLDMLSNGFKLRGTFSNINTNAATYIYAAFAENPFKNSNAR